MILKKRDAFTVTATAEDADDLLALRRVIACGHTITGSTTRVIKRDRDYSRPDRGERVRITTSIAVEKISLDGTLGRLRISGTVSESNNEAVPRGAHHSMTILAGQAITITKGDTGGSRQRRWSATEYKILGGSTTSGTKSGFILVAIDTSECGIAVLRGTHLRTIPNIYSGRGGKRYKTSHSMDDFFGQVVAAIHATLAEEQGIDHAVMFGPSNTKNRLANYIKTGQRRGSTPLKITIVEGIDSGGEDGIHVFTRSDAMRETISGSKLALVSGILDRIIEYAHKKIPRYAMGYAETSEAARVGAVDALICSDGALEEKQEKDTEQKIIDLLNSAEESGARVYMVDSSTDIGLRASGLGGVVALLRYAIRQ